MRVGGRLRHFHQAWSRDRWSHRIVRQGLTWSWVAPPPAYRSFFQPSTPLLENFIQDLKTAGAIEETKSLLFQGPLFTVPKKGTTKRRVILDLSALNKSILCPSFKMTTIRDVMRALPRGAFATSIDLKDAYWHIPIKPYYRKFLGFRIGEVKYQFRAMPFGLNIAPRVFTKLCRTILKQLRLQGIQVLVYLDDWLIWANSVEQCRLATQKVIQVLTKRGFLVNMEKSRLEPAQKFQWLGILWDTVKTTLSLPKDKVESLFRDLSAFLKRRTLTRRQLESMLGKLQFAAIVDPVGKALLKAVNPCLKGLARQGLRDRVLPFPRGLRKSLMRWKSKKILRSSIPFRPPPPSIDVYTDASRQGWGVHSSEGHALRGSWSPTLRTCHINVLEMVAVFLALKRLPLHPGSHVRVHSDNTTVVNCINRQGSARSRVLNSWVLSILTLLQKKRLAISLFHVAGVSNLIADNLSRQGPSPSEWSLDRESFNWICRNIAQPQVDLFATRNNTRLPLFVSPVRDSAAVGVNALSLDWNQWEIVYLFPPTNLLSKVLNHLQSFRGKAILITPNWPNQAWYPVLVAKTKECCLIPNPKLYQEIGQEIYYAASKHLSELLCWTL